MISWEMIREEMRGLVANGLENLPDSDYKPHYSRMMKDALEDMIKAYEMQYYGGE